ncbi:hypothetical protein CIB84_010935 [Bambusicola thoracicus]|uniref:Uncharacterized protein n=1 Tax=Bambusicola thoracicus TaxID=9083 RepID=A0A2P4SMK9_BAMTH|nr:hypothetical protein CIB84_010935 [Bambusicola thoracicus]
MLRGTSSCPAFPLF